MPEPDDHGGAVAGRRSKKRTSNAIDIPGFPDLVGRGFSVAFVEILKSHQLISLL